MNRNHRLQEGHKNVQEHYWLQRQPEQAPSFPSIRGRQSEPRQRIVREIQKIESCMTLQRKGTESAHNEAALKWQMVTFGNQFLI